MKRVAISASFDDLRSPQVRFLEEAAKLGDVSVLLWSDDAVRAVTGKAPKFPQAERLYLLEAIRYVRDVRIVNGALNPDTLPLLVQSSAFGTAPHPGPLPANAGRGRDSALEDRANRLVRTNATAASFPLPPLARGEGQGEGSRPDELRIDIWAVDEPHDTPAKRAFCEAHHLTYHVISSKSFAGFPKADLAIAPPTPGRKKVVVTGCYDWFHSGHVRFFEEVSEHGDLYVIAGNDANVEHLKGAGHPLFREDERRYLCASIRYVHQALITTGWGWLDAEPEMRRIKPDIYAVNEDGDKPEKREFCEKNGIQYLVLKRVPKEGLTRRTSTNLRGF
ncbi:MAG: adenylyltransferase/cytidyltransferase family protein [Verrucomicrobia bacterium]|nr:adenylyltransferase/cytidyltransferase family protein [Verrucomicrobiota bacterium]